MDMRPYRGLYAQSHILATFDFIRNSQRQL